MPTYLIELYVPREQVDEARASGRRAHAAAEVVTSGGTPVRYLRTTFLPDDETCLHLFEAVETRAVEAVCALAGLERARIVTAIELT